MRDVRGRGDWGIQGWRNLGKEIGGEENISRAEVLMKVD